jgi:hypothetical protein
MKTRKFAASQAGWLAWKAALVQKPLLRFGRCSAAAGACDWSDISLSRAIASLSFLDNFFLRVVGLQRWDDLRISC